MSLHPNIRIFANPQICSQGHFALNEADKFLDENTEYDLFTRRKDLRLSTCEQIPGGEIRTRVLDSLNNDVVYFQVAPKGHYGGIRK